MEQASWQHGRDPASLCAAAAGDLSDTMAAEEGPPGDQWMGAHRQGPEKPHQHPMQMDVVAAGIANNGAVMKPNLVEQIQAPDLSVIEKTKPEAHGQAVSEETAKKV